MIDEMDRENELRQMMRLVQAEASSAFRETLVTEEALSKHDQKLC